MQIQERNSIPRLVVLDGKLSVGEGWLWGPVVAALVSPHLTLNINRQGCAEAQPGSRLAGLVAILPADTLCWEQLRSRTKDAFSVMCCYDRSRNLKEG